MPQQPDRPTFNPMKSPHFEGLTVLSPTVDTMRTTPQGEKTRIITDLDSNRGLFLSGLYFLTLFNHADSGIHIIPDFTVMEDSLQDRYLVAREIPGFDQVREGFWAGSETVYFAMRSDRARRQAAMPVVEMSSPYEYAKAYAAFANSAMQQRSITFREFIAEEMLAMQTTDPNLAAIMFEEVNRRFNDSQYNQRFMAYVGASFVWRALTGLLPANETRVIEPTYEQAVGASVADTARHLIASVVEPIIAGNRPEQGMFDSLGIHRLSYREILYTLGAISAEREGARALLESFSPGIANAARRLQVIVLNLDSVMQATREQFTQHDATSTGILGSFVFTKSRIQVNALAVRMYYESFAFALLSVLYQHNWDGKPKTTFDDKALMRRFLDEVLPEGGISLAERAQRIFDGLCMLNGGEDSPTSLQAMRRSIYDRATQNVKDADKHRAMYEAWQNMGFVFGLYVAKLLLEQ